MISPEVVEIVSTVVSPATFPPSVPKKRNPGEVEVGGRATSAEMKVISLETVRLNLPVGEGIATIVVSLDICPRTVPRRGSLGEVVEVDHAMDVERKGISRETVPPRPEVAEVEDALIVGKMVTSYVFFTSQYLADVSPESAPMKRWNAKVAVMEEVACCVIIAGKRDIW